MNRIAFVSFVFVVAGCGGSAPQVPPPPPPVSYQTPTPPDWVKGVRPENLPEDTHVVAVATSTNADTARKAALAALDVRLLGTPESRPFDIIPSSLGELADPTLTQRWDDPSGNVSILLAASRQTFGQRLIQWVDLLLPPDPFPGTVDGMIPSEAQKDPRGHLDTLIGHLQHQQAETFSCQRRAAVKTSTCTVESRLDAIEAQVKHFSKQVKLRPRYHGGVPYRTGSGALRPATVTAELIVDGHPPVPMPSLPLIFERTDDPETKEPASTDGSGRAILPRGIAFEPGLTWTAAIDREKLLGRSKDLWTRGRPARIVPRLLDGTQTRLRWNLTETAMGSTSDTGISALARGLKRKGLTSLGSLDPELATPYVLEPLEPNRLPNLADAARGAIDVLLVGELDSHFSSQMSARSVWFEGTSRLTLYDVWTGTVIKTWESSARAVAIGERAASKKALRVLANQLAEEIKTALVDYRPQMNL